METRFPPVITNANNLNAWHVTVGNTTHPDGAPEAPPPVRTPKPAAPTANGSTLSWTAATGVTKHRLEYTSDGGDTWTVASDTITTNSHTVALPCGGTYSFRLSAYGDGTTYHDAWSHASDSVGVTTAACAPVFGQETYTISVAENVARFSVVGTVAATDADGDAVTTTSRPETAPGSSPSTCTRG